MYWKLAITQCTGKAMMAVILSLSQALNGANWSDFTPTQKFTAIALAAGAGWGIIDAFLNKTMSELSDDDKSSIAKETSSFQAPANSTTPVP